MIGLYKTELIYMQGLWELDEIEFATLVWVDWRNHRRLLEPMRDVRATLDTAGQS